MAEIIYIGGFPPPFGGVTVKNDLLYSELSKYVDLKKNNAKFKTLKYLKDVWMILFSKKSLIIGVSASRGKSGFLTSLLYKFNRGTMLKSLYFMMGGTEANLIAANPKRITQYKQYGRIYVETDSMKRILENVGLQNVSLFPNCRNRPDKEFIAKKNLTGVLKCVFFSNIQLTKGVDIILNAATKLLDVEFYFYGFVEKEYEQEFLKQVATNKNIFYLGIFTGKSIEVYQELSKYDILLFPTRWKNEGVPGVLIEGKIAALAEIATDICYNKELIEDGVSGTIINVNSATALTGAIQELNDDREKLYEYKKNSVKSAETFYIDKYITSITQILKG